MAKNKWVTRVIITPVSGVITLLITEKGPPCRTLNLCSFLHQPLQWICWVARYAPKKTSINHDEIYQTYQTCQRCFRITQAWGFTAQTRLAVGHDEIWQSIRILCSIAVLNSPPKKKGMEKLPWGWFGYHLWTQQIAPQNSSLKIIFCLEAFCSECHVQSCTGHFEVCWDTESRSLGSNETMYNIYIYII